MYDHVYNLIRAPAVARAIYSVAFVSENPTSAVVHFIRLMSEAKECKLYYEKLVWCQTGRLISAFQRDRGASYLDNELRTSLTAGSVELPLIQASSLHLDGVADRMNLTMLN